MSELFTALLLRLLGPAEGPCSLSRLIVALARLAALLEAPGPRGDVRRAAVVLSDHVRALAQVHGVTLDEGPPEQPLCGDPLCWGLAWEALGRLCSQIDELEAQAHGRHLQGWQETAWAAVQLEVLLGLLASGKLPPRDPEPLEEPPPASGEVLVRRAGCEVSHGC